MTDKQANNITKEQAIRILHPDTRVEAIDDYEEAGNYEHAYDTAILMAIVALRGPEWVRTADRLPEAADGITGATGEPEVLTICEHAHGWFPEVIRVSKVVRMPKYYWYWMPLPEPPKEESDERFAESD